MTETVTGTVSNGNGLCISERDGWLNVSNYAKPEDAPMPKLGERITVMLDKAGYVRKVEPVIMSAKAEPAQPEQGAPRGRDAVVTRLACLNTATAILSSGAREVDAEDVLAIAAVLEAWATR